MSRISEWKCDGCGKVERVGDEEIPARFTVWRVTTELLAKGPWEMGTLELPEAEDFDLCRDCRGRLHPMFRPTEWPRPTPQPTPGDNQDMALAVEALEGETEG